MPHTRIARELSGAEQEPVRRRGGIESVPVVAVARVGEQGDVMEVHMDEIPGADVTAAGSTALFRSEFKPALRDGRPVAMDFLLDLTLDR